MMKAQTYLIRLALGAMIWGILGAANLPARETYEDKELRGTIVKVDQRAKIIKLDRGSEHKLKSLKWTSKTRFLQGDNERPFEPRDLKEGDKVRLYYSDNKKKLNTRDNIAILIKVIVNPKAAGARPEYNR